MSTIGTVSVNGQTVPRMWSFVLTVELSAGASPVLVDRMRAVERRIDRITVGGDKGRIAAVVLALEQVADVAHGGGQVFKTRKGRQRHTLPRKSKRK